MKPPVLLTYNLYGDRAAKIRLVAMRFRIRVRGVLAAEYDRPVGELVDTAPGGTWEGAAFSDEMLVMAHFPAPLLQAFLQGMRRAGVRPVALKAVLTPTNAAWDSNALHAELCKEREAISAGSASVHTFAQEDS